MFLKDVTPKSSFLSVEKDLNIIVNSFLANDRIKKLLYYTSKDCLSRPKLTAEQSYELLNKNIKIIPKLKVDSDVLNYIVINFDNFSTNVRNPEFRDNIIEFDIICHFDQWQLNDSQLRPYKIAAEIDSMINNEHLTGIGTLEFTGAVQIILSEEYAGICLIYRAVHGEEDKKKQVTPELEEQFLSEFKDYLHSELLDDN